MEEIERVDPSAKIPRRTRRKEEVVVVWCGIKYTAGDLDARAFPTSMNPCSRTDYRLRPVAVSKALEWSGSLTRACVLDQRGWVGEGAAIPLFARRGGSLSRGMWW